MTTQLTGPVLQYIRDGYPEGVPDRETAALYAVLHERIGGERALDVLRRLHTEGLLSEKAARALLPDDVQMRKVAAEARPRRLAARRRDRGRGRPAARGQRPGADRQLAARGLPGRRARPRLRAAAGAARAPADPRRGQEDRQGAAPRRRQPGRARRTSPRPSPSTPTATPATTTCAGCATSCRRRAGRSSSPTPTCPEAGLGRLPVHGRGWPASRPLALAPAIRTYSDARPASLTDGRRWFVGAGCGASTSGAAHGSMPRRRAERARWRLARRRRRRLMSIGSCSSADGWSMSELSTW